MLKLIMATSPNGIIGDKNKLIFDCKEDMKHFQASTMGQTVIMGRKTYESIGRGLPGRNNIVVSSTVDSLPGAIVVYTLNEAVALDRNAWIIGGAMLYQQAQSRVDEAYITVIGDDIEGDCKFIMDLTDFLLVGRTILAKDAVMCHYKRRK